jgi:hypothetical protein
VVIILLSKEGLAPVAIKQRLDGVYGKASSSYPTVFFVQFDMSFGRSNVMIAY